MDMTNINMTSVKVLADTADFSKYDKSSDNFDVTAYSDVQKLTAGYEYLMTLPVHLRQAARSELGNFPMLGEYYKFASGFGGVMARVEAQYGIALAPIDHEDDEDRVIFVSRMFSARAFVEVLGVANAAEIAPELRIGVDPVSGGVMFDGDDQVVRLGAEEDTTGEGFCYKTVMKGPYAESVADVLGPNPQADDLLPHVQLAAQEGRMCDSPVWFDSETATVVHVQARPPVSNDMSYWSKVRPGEVVQCIEELRDERIGNKGCLVCSCANMYLNGVGTWESSTASVKCVGRAGHYYIGKGMHLGVLVEASGRVSVIPAFGSVGEAALAMAKYVMCETHEGSAKGYCGCGLVSAGSASMAVHSLDGRVQMKPCGGMCRSIRQGWSSHLAAYWAILKDKAGVWLPSEAKGVASILGDPSQHLVPTHNSLMSKYGLKFHGEGNWASGVMVCVIPSRYEASQGKLGAWRGIKPGVIESVDTIQVLPAGLNFVKFGWFEFAGISFYAGPKGAAIFTFVPMAVGTFKAGLNFSSQKHVDYLPNSRVFEAAEAYGYPSISMIDKYKPDIQVKETDWVDNGDGTETGKYGATKERVIGATGPIFIEPKKEVQFNHVKLNGPCSLHAGPLNETKIVVKEASEFYATRIVDAEKWDCSYYVEDM